MNAVMDAISGDLLPALTNQRGFRGYSVFGNPDSGGGGLITVWESRKDLLRSGNVEKALRETALEAASLDRLPIVEEYDLLAWEGPPNSPFPQTVA